MKKTIVLSLLFLISTQFAFSSQLPVKNQDVSPEQLKSQNKQIASLVADELSKDLPKTIDKYTEFTDIKAIDSNLIYTFEINTGSKSDITIQNEDKTRMQNAVINGICTSSKRFMDAQILITYLYISKKTQVELFKFSVSQDDCYKLYGSY